MDDLAKMIEDDASNLATWALGVERESDLGMEVQEFWGRFNTNPEEILSRLYFGETDTEIYFEVGSDPYFPDKVILWWSALNSEVFDYNNERQHELVKFTEGHSGASFGFMVGRARGIVLEKKEVQA